MFVYIIIFITITLIALFFLYKKKTKHYLLFSLCIFLGLFSGARNESLGGYDTSMYKYLYENSSKNFPNIDTPDAIVNATEKGYVALMSLFNTIGLNFNIFLLGLGVVTSFLFYLFLKQYSLYPFLFLMIFLSKGYLYYFFTAQRQIIAMLICWLSLKYVLQKQFIKFSLIIIIASFFHISALAFLFVYFLNEIKLDNKKVYMLILVSVILGIFKIGTYLTGIVYSYLPFGSEKLMQYVEGGSNSINILNFFEITPILIFVLYNRNVIKDKTKYFNLFFNLFVFYIIITFAFADFAIIARLKGYFLIGYLVIISAIPYCFKSKKEGSVVLLLASFYFFAVFIRELLVFDNGKGYLPYHTFLS